MRPRSSAGLEHPVPDREAAGSNPAGATKSVLHFVGFRGDEYTSARRVWGRPDFFHLGWDLRAQREIATGDVVVFAKGDAGQEPRQRSFPDIVEP